MLNESLSHLGKYCAGWHQDNPGPQKTDLKERWRGDRKTGLSKKRKRRRMKDKGRGRGALENGELIRSTIQISLKQFEYLSP